MSYSSLTKYSTDPVNAFGNLKSALKNDFIKQKEQWIIRKIGFKLRDTFYNRKIKKLKSFDELKNEYEKFQENIDLDFLYQKYMEQIEAVINEDSYNIFLRYYDNKGIFTKFLPQLRLKGEVPYKNVVFEYLKEHSEVLEILRNRYFSKIISD